jgi:hypothetical protein
MLRICLDAKKVTKEKSRANPVCRQAGISNTFARYLLFSFCTIAFPAFER